MKNLVYCLFLIAILNGCKSVQPVDATAEQPIIVNLDLVNVEDDKIEVVVDPGRFTDPQTTFFIPKTVPGTYSIDDYGAFVEDLRALDYDGGELPVSETGENTWVIENAEDLDRVTYRVNDSYDAEGEKGVFSPAGTNIKEDENFMLNLHGFVGYFENREEQPFQLIIDRPADLFPGTALEVSETTTETGEPETVTDIFRVSRYFEVVDNPIMYAAPDTASIDIEGMDVLLHVYSPNDVYSAEDIRPEMQRTMSAQKDFLGDIDATSKYAILLYLSDPQDMDARGFGALEHHTSTVVVLPEPMPLERLNQTMTDVVSHEFFHILTPLSIHSEEIHYFDYNDPEMSKHLWMYEGVTEYFSQLFQVNQDLISNNEFYDRISEKIENSRNYTDTIPFTVLSENILEEPYKNEFYNVYLKGTLIGMTLDIRLRELSDGDYGLLDLMKELSERFGKDKPFEDDELIPTIVDLTYPEIQDFFDTYVSGTTPIPYEEFLEKAGVTIQSREINTSYFIKGQTPYIDGNPETMELFFREDIELNSFLKELGVQQGDIIKSVNGVEYTIENVYDLVMKSQSWEEGDDITMLVIRNGQEVALSGEVTQPTDEVTEIREMDLPPNDPRVELRQAWLKD